jgi:hypothetical protein
MIRDKGGMTKFALTVLAIASIIASDRNIPRIGGETREIPDGCSKFRVQGSTCKHFDLILLAKMLSLV